MLTEVLPALAALESCMQQPLAAPAVGMRPSDRGVFWSPCGPCCCLTSRKKQDWTPDICTKYSQNVGTSRQKGVWRTGQGGKLQDDKGKHKDSGADEEVRWEVQPPLFQHPGSVRDLVRAVEPTLLPGGELGKMRLGKSRCLRNLFKFTSP